MKPVFQSLGISVTEVTFKKLIGILDANGDGLVSRDEFLDWRMSNGDKDDEDPEESAKAVFKMLIQIGKENSEYGNTEDEEGGEKKEGDKKESVKKEGGEEEEEELTTYTLQCALIRFTKDPYKIDLTESEIAQIVKDFDEEGTGVVEFETFFKMISEGNEHE